MYTVPSLFGPLLCGPLLFGLTAFQHPVDALPPRDGAPTQAHTPTQARPTDGDDLRLRDRPTDSVPHDDPITWILLDWAGARQRLEDLGLGVDVLYTADGSWSALGGADEQGTALRGVLDATFTYATEPLLGLPGGRLHVGFEHIGGADGSNEAGVVQPISNIDADERTQIGRIWYEQAFASSRTRLRIGKIDANSLFAVPESATEFIHSSMGFSPTVFLMPTYPDAAFGFVAEQELARATVRAGVFDGALAQGVRTGARGPSSLFDDTDAWFWIGEAAWSWDGGRALLGAWTHTGSIARFDGGSDEGTSGSYAVLEQRLWSRATDFGGGGQALDAFAQWGSADADVSPFAEHVGLGVRWKAPFGRRGDALGLGLSHVALTDRPGAGFASDTETAFELFYGFEAARWIRMKAAAQYVVDPGGREDVDDLVVLTLRATLAL